MAYPGWTEESLEALLKNRGTKPMPAALVPKTKPQKYGNRRVVDETGAVHDSGKEYRHWCELELRERAGEIRSLRRQVPYALVVNGVLVCTYIADFDYIEGEAPITEDVKSEPTRKLAAYRIKRKLFAALYGRDIREV